MIIRIMYSSNTLALTPGNIVHVKIPRIFLYWEGIINLKMRLGLNTFGKIKVLAYSKSSYLSNCASPYLSAVQYDRLLAYNIYIYIMCIRTEAYGRAKVKTNYGWYHSRGGVWTFFFRWWPSCVPRILYHYVFVFMIRLRRRCIE